MPLKSFSHNKLEIISLVSFAINLVILFSSGAYYLLGDEPLFFQLIFPLYTILSICVLFELFTWNEIHFIAAIFIHFLVLLILFTTLGLINPLVSLCLAFFIFLNVALKLRFSYAIGINSVMLILFSLSLVRKEDKAFFPFLFFFITGAVLLLFTQVIIFYREELISRTRGEEEKDRSIDKLETVSESLLQHLTDVREESAEEERYRITRELHDSLGYAMTNISMIMNAAQYLLEEDPEKVRQYCIKTRDMATATMKETRTTLYKLREITRDLPSNPAFFFDKMCRDFQEATGIATECQGGNFSNPVSERIFTTVYRIVQVGFINALKHGETETIRLFFWVDGDLLSMTIWNNINRVVENSRLEEGIGLKGARERLNELNGSLLIEQTFEGFSLKAELPLKAVE